MVIGSPMLKPPPGKFGPSKKSQLPNGVAGALAAEVTLTVDVGLPGNNGTPPGTPGTPGWLTGPPFVRVTSKVNVPPGAKPGAAILQTFRSVGLKIKFVNSATTSPGLWTKATLPILGLSAGAAALPGFLPSNPGGAGVVSPLALKLFAAVAAPFVAEQLFVALKPAH
jgi:hypothetical protein